MPLGSRRCRSCCDFFARGTVLAYRGTRPVAITLQTQWMSSEEFCENPDYAILVNHNGVFFAVVKCIRRLAVCLFHAPYLHPQRIGFGHFCELNFDHIGGNLRSVFLVLLRCPVRLLIRWEKAEGSGPKR